MDIAVLCEKSEAGKFGVSWPVQILGDCKRKIDTYTL